MCGLAGYRRRDGRPAERDDIVRMLDRQQHRGPDGRGVWVHAATALGLDRLSILDLSEQGHQPFVTPDDTGVVAATGRSATRGALSYADDPHPSTDGTILLYQCDWSQSYDDQDDLCRIDETGNVTLYHTDAHAVSLSSDGTVAHARSVLSGGQFDYVLVVEPLQTNRDPNGPGQTEYPNFADLTETAWSPDGNSPAMVRSGKLWIASMPWVTHAVEFAHVDGTTIFGVSWRSAA